ncbi:MAG: hypothetical protein KBC91_05310 [Candidatus Omnitrophica bacterium]|nr:hypothetical protein [Candidatus Omnitrophota bacterium]
MTFEELRESLRKLPVEIKSDAVEFYLEAVFVDDQRPALEIVLSQYFGSPFKMANQSPTPESDAYAGRYGGAKANQTLYVKTREGGGLAADVALIWPWNAGGRYTLKLMRG